MQSSFRDTQQGVKTGAPGRETEPGNVSGLDAIEATGCYYDKDSSAWGGSGAGRGGVCSTREPSMCCGLLTYTDAGLARWPGRCMLKGFVTEL